MPTLQATSRVVLSPELLGIITSYQRGCCVDMLALASVVEPVKDIVDARLWWQDGAFVGQDALAAFDLVVMAWYAELGQSRLLKLFACLPRMRDAVVAHAVYSGNLRVLADLPVDVVRAVDIPLLDLAALKGHLGVLNFLHADVGHNGCTMWAVDSAAIHGHCDIVAFLLVNRREGCSHYGVEGAGANGQLEIVKLFLLHTPRSGLLVALTAAAIHNHFDIVQYIFDTVGTVVTYATDAMDQAARHGLLEMVQFLDELDFDCTTNAMDWAAAFGHLEVVKWLHEHRTEGCTEYAMDDAAEQGHSEVVQWLHDHRQEGCTGNALMNAIDDERWDLVLLLAWHCDDDDVEVAVARGLECAETPADVVAELRSILQRLR